MNILVIDDDEAMRRMVRMMLVSGGHQVVEAENGQAGLEALQRQAPDVVVTDLVMPVMDGIETITAIRKQGFTVRIIAMSAGRKNVPLGNWVETARAAGADATLAKPFR